MPAPVRKSPEVVVTAYTRALEIPKAVWSVWHRNEMQANVMLPHALAALKHELAGGAPTPGQLWLALSNAHDVEMVLSCTEWAMGAYPVFIFCNPAAATETLSATALAARVERLVDELRRRVPVERVYSVFAPARVTKAFARLWTASTGAAVESDPYYSAVFTHCTRQTITRRRQTLVQDRRYTLRRADDADTAAVAALCKGFASTSEPFVLSDDGALKEARYLIRNRIAWLHEVEVAGVRIVASLVATTRLSDGVAGITKVYTSPDARKQGCAERLVRHVTQQLLLHEGKQAVVLYVAHNNPGAAKVYHRVGFQGLAASADSSRPAGVEDWLELGFQGAELGHW